MNVIINNETVELPRENMTLAEVAVWREIPEAGTAIAVNNKICRRVAWDATYLSEGDRLTVISASFGG